MKNLVDYSKDLEKIVKKEAKELVEFVETNRNKVEDFIKETYGDEAKFEIKDNVIVVKYAEEEDVVTDWYWTPEFDSEEEVEEYVEDEEGYITWGPSLNAAGKYEAKYRRHIIEETTKEEIIDLANIKKYINK